MWGARRGMPTACQARSRDRSPGKPAQACRQHRIIRADRLVLVGADKPMAGAICGQHGRHRVFIVANLIEIPCRIAGHGHKKRRAGRPGGNAQPASRRLARPNSRATKMPIGASSTTSHRHGNCRNRSSAAGSTAAAKKGTGAAGPPQGRAPAESTIAVCPATGRAAGTTAAPRAPLRS